MLRYSGSLTPAFYRLRATSPRRTTRSSTAPAIRAAWREKIPLCGRIVALADVYDALTSCRVYKQAMTHEQARNIIALERGGHFDPEIVDAFLRAEDQITTVQTRMGGNRDRGNRASPESIAIAA